MEYVILAAAAFSVYTLFRMAKNRLRGQEAPVPISYHEIRFSYWSKGAVKPTFRDFYFFPTKPNEDPIDVGQNWIRKMLGQLEGEYDFKVYRIKPVPTNDFKKEQIKLRHKLYGHYDRYHNCPA